MSRKPGIGFGHVEHLKKQYSLHPGMTKLLKNGWWPADTVTFGRKKYAIGRYLREKQLDALGITVEQREAHRHEEMKAKAAQSWCISGDEEDQRRKAKVESQKREPRPRTF